MNDGHELEENLRAGRAALPPGLRPRVLTAMRGELTRDRSGQFLRQAVAAAAGIVLWIHLSWSATLDTRIALRGVDPDDLRLRAAEIQQLVPEWAGDEARRQAILLTAGRNLRPPVSAVFARRTKPEPDFGPN